MEQKTYDVFISYSRKDYVDKEGKEIPGNVISIIRETLQKHRISYWMDEEGNLTAKKFASIIAGKIRESMAFLFVCSKNSVASRWVERELSVADTHDKHIIPFICDDSYKDDKVVMYTAAVNRIEYFTSPKKALNMLVSVIEGDKMELDKKKLKEEINGLVDDYQVHSAQQEMIVQQLISKNVSLGVKSKLCPVCDNTVSLNKFYCDKCGWQFPNLYSLDGRKTPVCDETHLALARAHWHSLDNVVALENDIKRKEKEIEEEKRKNVELRVQYEALEQRQKEIKNADAWEQAFIVDGVSFKMIRVEGGTFQMGAQKTDPNGPNYDVEAWDDESPVHKVTLNSFYIGEVVVTQALWKAVMESEPTWNGGWESKCGKGNNYPAYRVSYNDIVNDFLPELNRLTGKNFRLPTEAEWEYAARGGKKREGYKYAGSKSINTVAVYDENSYNKGSNSPEYGTHIVKSKSPNGLGLFDMSGNVWEWCQDWYGNYSDDSQTNPTGPSIGSNRVLRGGSWGDNARHCRVSSRYYENPTSNRYNCIGFRLVLPQ